MSAPLIIYHGDIPHDTPAHWLLQHFVDAVAAHSSPVETAAISAHGADRLPRGLAFMAGGPGDSRLWYGAEAAGWPVVMACLPNPLLNAGFERDRMAPGTADDLLGPSGDGWPIGERTTAALAAAARLPDKPGKTPPLYALTELHKALQSTPLAGHVKALDLPTPAPLPTPPKAKATADGAVLVDVPAAIMPAIDEALDALAASGAAPRLVFAHQPYKGAISAVVHIADAHGHYDHVVPQFRALTGLPVITTRSALAHLGLTGWPIDNPGHAAEWIAALGAAGAGLGLATRPLTTSAGGIGEPPRDLDTLLADISASSRATPARGKAAANPGPAVDPPRAARADEALALVGAVPGAAILKICFGTAGSRSQTPLLRFTDKTTVARLARELGLSAAMLPARLGFEDPVLARDAAKDDRFFRLLASSRAAGHLLDLQDHRLALPAAPNRIKLTLNSAKDIAANGWYIKPYFGLMWRPLAGAVDLMILAGGLQGVAVTLGAEQQRLLPDCDGLVRARMACEHDWYRPLDLTICPFSIEEEPEP